jgi:hypothetical protein
VQRLKALRRPALDGVELDAGEAMVIELAKLARRTSCSPK